jgi:uncharacterized protein YyaL (SSP411 family)
MAHESFEDAEIAALMNRLFVNIKVDREERPDIDQIYMAALHALGEQGGWPLTMFLTPEGKPIWGGTYFPKQARYGRPGFGDVLVQLSRLYAEERDNLRTQAETITAHLAKPKPPGGTIELGADLLDRAADGILSIMDPERGGTKGAPKFPNVPVLDFLARSAARTGRDDLTEIVDVTLTAMANGGIFDHIGGGYARYSVDADWLAPHFEKMLSDNGLLLEQLALASLRSANKPMFRDRIETTVDWLIREMLLPGGAFAASLDADSEGREGAFYVWDRAELDSLLDPDDATFIAVLYDIAPGGNWEGRSIANRLNTPQDLDPASDARRRDLLAQMLEHRKARIRPGLDDKILVDWNGYAITGIATAAMLFDRADWLDLAEGAYRFITESIALSGRLGHSLRHGKRVHPGFASDLAAMARAAIALHQATQKADYLRDAGRFLDDLDRHHASLDGGFYFAADDAEALILRKADRTDDATPNPHGLAADSLIRLWALTGEDRLRDRADAILAGSANEISANVFGTASLLSALDLRLAIRSTVIVVPEGASPETLRRTVLDRWRSNWTLDLRREGDALPPSHPAHSKGAVHGAPTAYVCQEGRCSLPVTQPEDLAALLARREEDQVFI